MQPFNKHRILHFVYCLGSVATPYYGVVTLFSILKPKNWRKKALLCATTFNVTVVVPAERDFYRKIYSTRNVG